MGHAHSRRQESPVASWHDDVGDGDAPPVEAPPPPPQNQLQRQPQRRLYGAPAAHITPATDRLSLLAFSEPEILGAILESLISRGALRSLASLNGTSRTLHDATLPFLWRTFIWDPHGKGRKKTKAYWSLLSASRGAEYIRFFVDRAKKPSSSHKNLPSLISQLSASSKGLLKAYVAECNDDGKTKYVDDASELKVICHLLPAYEPLSPGDEDMITLRHALVHLAAPFGRNNQPSPKNQQPSSIGYAFFIIHPCHSSTQHRPLPSFIDSYSARHHLPVLPVKLDAVLLPPSAPAFTQADEYRLARIVFEFLASMDQEPCQDGVQWNGFVGEFSTQRIQEEEDCRSYIEFHRQKGDESVLVCAQATVHALTPFRGSQTFNWVELKYDNHMRFNHDNKSIHKILETLLPIYREHAPRRVCPPEHGMGDVIIQDISDVLSAGLKRVAPPAGRQQEVERDVVEYYIKRYPEGTADDQEEDSWGNTHDEYVVYLKEFPV
ncbi:hypothetical protein QFC21_003904 [Naganishia friedmannii]|uniref:Uncharacterized protein n=1 Tax=Naganishia friedmannii TaxID=89922 RepID=A0ACC2VLM1_9TREE|nr:hypothetical protein QFC21_003904 [Naganishia friedmannii]